MAYASINSVKKLEGKVAIITGGASGIGEASVRLFVENGAEVVIADVQDDKGTYLASELGGDVATYKHCDVSKEDDVESLVAFTLEKHGKLDIMFNNAGILGKSFTKDVASVDMADLDKVFSINARGMVLGVKHASIAMLQTKTKGSIICTSSVASVLGGLASVAYTVSKHAVIGLMRAASSDLKQHSIRVNCISPGGVPTPLVVNFMREATSNPSLTFEDAQQACDQVSPLAGHTLRALDVARAALYLASDDGAYVNGHNLVVDGGLTTSCQGLQQ